MLAISYIKTTTLSKVRILIVKRKKIFIYYDITFYAFCFLFPSTPFKEALFPFDILIVHDTIYNWSQCYVSHVYLHVISLTISPTPTKNLIYDSGDKTTVTLGIRKEAYAIDTSLKLKKYSITNHILLFLQI